MDCDIKTININKVKEDANLFLFNHAQGNMEAMKIVNVICNAAEVHQNDIKE